MSTSSATTFSKRDYTPIPEAERRNKLQRINFESFFKKVDSSAYSDLLAPYKEKKFNECCAEQKKLITCIMKEQVEEWPEDYSVEELEAADDWCENWSVNGQYKTLPLLPTAHAAATIPRNNEEVQAGNSGTADGIDWEEFWSRADTVAKIDAFVEDYYERQKIQRAAVFQVKKRKAKAIKAIAVREEVTIPEAAAKYRSQRRQQMIDYKKYGTTGMKIKKLKEMEEVELQMIEDTLMEDAPEEEQQTPTPEIEYVKIDCPCDACGQTFTTVGVRPEENYNGNLCNACIIDRLHPFN